MDHPLPKTPILTSFWPPPDLSLAAFVAPNAVVMGQVSVAAGVSIWYGAVVRGDVERIEIGDRTNIQDGAILHGDPGKPTVLEDHVTVGHRAVIH
ncbi:MAG: gamma carbonic anhydrase family protein, partial [Moorea sp. SIO2C4]|nr:gamma carbonic anhydrase family protein [Moorena sp. SIO2C4]